MGNKWFKHWNTAHEGLSIQSFITEKNLEAVAAYWILLELVSQFEHEDARGHVDIPVSLLAKRWNMTQPKVERMLAQLSVKMRSTFKCILSDSQPKVASISLANWLELQEARGGKRSAKNEQKAGRSKKREVRSKKKEKRDEDFTPIKEFSDPPRLVEILRLREVTTAAQQAWLEAYPNAAWIKQEIFKALAWEESKGERKERFAQFIGNWLSRGWTGQPATVPVSRAIKTFEEMAAGLGLANG